MKKDLKKNVLVEIEKKEIKPVPRSIFQIVKALSLVSLAFLGLLAIYLFNLSFYLPRRGLSIAEMMARPVVLSSIPWTLVVLASALIGLIAFIYIRYEGGYKKNIFWTLVTIAVLAVVGGAMISTLNLNERLERRPGFNRMYGNFERNFVPGRRHMIDPRPEPLNFHRPTEMKYFN